MSLNLEKKEHLTDRPWTPGDVRVLRQMKEERNQAKYIGIILGRSANAVHSKWQRIKATERKYLEGCDHGTVNDSYVPWYVRHRRTLEIVGFIICGTLFLLLASTASTSGIPH